MCFFVKRKLFTFICMYKTWYILVCVCVCVYVGMYVESGKSSPSSDFCKRLGTFLAPRLSQIGRDMTDFVNKSKTTRYIL